MLIAYVAVMSFQRKETCLGSAADQRFICILDINLLPLDISSTLCLLNGIRRSKKNRRFSIRIFMKTNTITVICVGISANNSLEKHL